MTFETTREYPEHIKQSLDRIYTYLCDNGAWCDHYQEQLEMLGDNYQIYDQAHRYVVDNGLCVYSGQNLVTNPALQVRAAVSRAISTLYDQLGITIKGTEKLKKAKKSDKSPLDKYIAK